MKNHKDAVRCSYEHQDSSVQKETKKDTSRELISKKQVSGVSVNPTFKDLFFNYDTTQIHLTLVIHMVSVFRQGNQVPVVNQNYLDTMLSTANDIWSQACINIAPYYTDILITEFKNLGISVFIGCNLSPQDSEIIDSYEIKTPIVKIANLFLVEETNGIACGDPFSGRIFMPTNNQSPERAGRTLAHEIGHLLLNPIGLSNSDNPEHLMYHAHLHPQPKGEKHGMYLSECVGAREIIKQDYFYGGKQKHCKMSPRLGNNLAIVWETAQQ